MDGRSVQASSCTEGAMPTVETLRTGRHSGTRRVNAHGIGTLRLVKRGSARGSRGLIPDANTAGIATSTTTRSESRLPASCKTKCVRGQDEGGWGLSSTRTSDPLTAPMGRGYATPSRMGCMQCCLLWRALCTLYGRSCWTLHARAALQASERRRPNTLSESKRPFWFIPG